MDDQRASVEQNVFDDETWAELPPVFENLPTPIRLVVWGDRGASFGEQEADTLCKTLADQFDTIKYRLMPRRDNYPYYPVIGVMGMELDEELDFGVRLIGLPTGYQMTSLIAAIQAVSFRGATLEPSTRINLHKLARDINVELVTSADNEGGPLMAKLAFGVAVASQFVRSYLIMSDSFPAINLRYSIKTLPHAVINGHVHVAGVVDESAFLKQIAVAARA